MRLKTKGVVLGVIGTSAYGTNPLFALPLYAAGLTVDSVLFYRYAIALILFGLYVRFYKKTPLKISLKQLIVLLPIGLCFAVSSWTLFTSYKYIDVGIASTILFVYPIIVALIMALFFHEKVSVRTLAAIALTTAGIALFYKGENGRTLNLYGVGLVLLSALSYAFYMIAIKKIPSLKGLKYSLVTFYVMAFGLLLFAYNLGFGAKLQRVDTPFLYGCVLLSAVLPTIVSLETMTIAIKMIGPTLSAILGALEPVTAILIGVFVFGERMTPRILTGIVLILLAVFIIVLQPKHKKMPSVH